MNLTKYDKLPLFFYERDPLVVSKDLLGKFLVRKTREGEIVGEIVETEAYVGPNDKASHTYNNKRTSRTLVQFGERGVAYVYAIYGMYYCFCIVVGPRNTPAVTLVRAVKPIRGVELMRRNRGLDENVPINRLANGPSKLCRAFRITSKLNGANLLGEDLFLCRGTQLALEVGESARIGIDYAEEYKNVQWRFHKKDSKFVSKYRGPMLLHAVRAPRVLQLLVEAPMSFPRRSRQDKLLLGLRGNTPSSFGMIAQSAGF